MERHTFDAYIIRVREDKSRSLVKGWAIYMGEHMKTLQIDEKQHPYLHECVSFGFSDILVDFNQWYGEQE